MIIVLSETWCPSVFLLEWNIVYCFLSFCHLCQQETFIAELSKRMCWWQAACTAWLDLFAPKLRLCSSHHIYALYIYMHLCVIWQLRRIQYSPFHRILHWPTIVYSILCLQVRLVSSVIKMMSVSHHHVLMTEFVRTETSALAAAAAAAHQDMSVYALTRILYVRIISLTDLLYHLCISSIYQVK